ncbi:MAG: DUF4143 domain-containing protein [Elusimicrobia bacterium]|nr:DUF4143 domain-containing protein [Elusimicrobiota bacterium]
MDSFARFLEAATFSQGSLLNISRVAEDCHVNRKVAEDYFQILQDLLISHQLPVFTKRAKRRLVSHPKFYFFDTGVFRNIRPAGPLDTAEESEGPALETLVLQNILAINDGMSLDYNVFYWRTADGKEVDFVLYGPRGLLAIEIKRSHRIDRTILSGLNSFLSDYPVAKAYLVYGVIAWSSTVKSKKQPINIFQISPTDYLSQNPTRCGGSDTNTNNRLLPKPWRNFFRRANRLPAVPHTTEHNNLIARLKLPRNFPGISPRPLAKGRNTGRNDRGRVP